MQIQAKMIEDSIHFDTKTRLSTLLVRMHRFMLPEIERHRVFSFSIGSSRAVPTRKFVQQVREDPAMPVKWGKNQRGMGADEELDPENGMIVWKEASHDAATHSEELSELGYAKEISNRILEPFQLIDVVITATDWDNFFYLRLDSAAQSEIRQIAFSIWDAMDQSTPIVLHPGEWHLPFVLPEERTMHDIETLKLCSSARVARTSYLNHDKTNPDVIKDIDLSNMLLSKGHWSPFEPQATPMDHPRLVNGNAVLAFNDPGPTHITRDYDVYSGNLRHFNQLRHMIEA